MADETSICNLALAKLGSSVIMALTDDSKQAQFCRRFYYDTRDEVLSSHRWNFAMKRTTLSRLATDPAFEWLYNYQLPTDCLRVVQLNGYETTEQLGEFAIEGRTLMTDAEEALIRYIGRVEDGFLYTPLFVEALSTKLAARLSAPITGSRSLSGELMAEYEKLTGAHARLSDAFEEHRRIKLPWTTSTLVAARFTRQA